MNQKAKPGFALQQLNWDKWRQGWFEMEGFLNCFPTLGLHTCGCAHIGQQEAEETNMWKDARTKRVKTSESVRVSAGKTYREFGKPYRALLSELYLNAMGSSEVLKP